MNKSEQLYEQYEDAFFALLMNEVAEENGKALMQKNEELSAEPSAAVPDRLTKRCLHLIEKNYRKVQIQNTARKAVRVLNRVALWILIPIFLFVGVFAASETVRVKTLNYLVEKLDVGTALYFSPEITTPENKESVPIASYAPSGYSLIYSNETDGFWIYRFENTDGSKMNLSIYSVETFYASAIVDTENADTWTEKIHECMVTFVEKQNHLQLYWTNAKKQSLYVVSGTNTLLQDMTDMAGNIIADN